MPISSANVVPRALLDIFAGLSLLAPMVAVLQAIHSQTLRIYRPFSHTNQRIPVAMSRLSHFSKKCPGAGHLYTTSNSSASIFTAAAWLMKSSRNTTVVMPCRCSTKPSMPCRGPPLIRTLVPSPMQGASRTPTLASTATKMSFNWRSNVSWSKTSRRFATCALCEMRFFRSGSSRRKTYPGKSGF